MEIKTKSPYLRSSLTPVTYYHNPASRKYGSGQNLIPPLKRKELHGEVGANHSKENRILGKEEAWDILNRGWPDGSVGKGAKSDDLSWTPRIDMVERENHLLQVVLCPSWVPWYMCMCKHTIIRDV